MLNLEIAKEFNDLNEVGLGVAKTAQRVKDFENDSFRLSVKNTLTEINVIVSDIVERVDKLVEKSADKTDDGLKYARISYWILFGFGILLVILLFLVLLILCC